MPMPPDNERRLRIVPKYEHPLQQEQIAPVIEEQPIAKIEEKAPDRGRLRFAGGVAALAFGIAAGIPIGIWSRDRNEYPVQGETFQTELGSIQIKGWSLYLDIDPERLTREFSGQKFQIAYGTTNTEGSEKPILFANVGSTPRDYDATGAYIGRTQVNGRDKIVLTALPYPDDNQATLEMRRRNGEKYANQKYYIMLPKPYEYKSDDITTRVYAEKPLPESEQGDLHNLFVESSGFMPPISLHLPDVPPYISFGVDQTSDRYRMNLHKFTAPEFKQQGVMELCDQIVSKNIDSSFSVWREEIDPQTSFMRASFDSGVHAAALKIQESGKKPEWEDVFKHPIFAAFDYRQVAANQFSNIRTWREFLAMSTTTIRYLPDEFMGRYIKMSTYEKFYARNLLRSSINQLTMMYQDQQGVQRLIPRGLEVQQFTGLNH